MIENDMPECVLTCYSVYGYLQEVKVVKYTKIYRFCPPESQVSNQDWRLNIKLRHLQ